MEIDSQEVINLCNKLEYIKGIVERGEKRKLDADEDIANAVLNYVKKLEKHAETKGRL